MKKPFLRVIAGLFIIIAVFLIYTSFRHNQKYKFSVSTEDMHAKILNGSHRITPAEAKKLLKNEDYIFVDLSNPRQYEYFHIEGSVNVPFEMVLNESYVSILEEDKNKVFISKDGIRAEEIWTLLTQRGYDNLFVLEGGRAYWRNFVANSDVFKKSMAYEDEKAKFDYKGLTSKKEKDSTEVKK